MLAHCIERLASDPSALVTLGWTLRSDFRRWLDCHSSARHRSDRGLPADCCCRSTVAVQRQWSGE